MKKILFLFSLSVPFILCVQNDQQFLIRADKLFDSESGQFKRGVSILVKFNIIQEVREDRELSAEEKKNGYVESGISIPKVLQFATINASSQLNWSNKIGKIKRGYLADIIAVDNDLEKNIQAILHVHFVMKDGKIFLNKL